jgi:thioredoxin reductase/Pyruvate/2-oxoacid:ferredoxin oxidoreductase delta subunit
MRVFLADILIYLLPMLGFWLLHVGIKARTSKRNLAALNESIATGMTEPASLHPVINTNRCLGCGSCVSACPEQAGHNVLGLISGKCTLVGPSYCIGHGACASACPQEAITLVFGTAKRGVDIPQVKPDFESNVPGLFIAGELGGMGLIRNAITQGCQALESIRKLSGIGSGEGLDLLIVGAGPAGFAASLGALSHKLRCVTVEQDTLGGTVSNFPRGKLVMTAPVEIPLLGQVNFRETTKETLIDFWQSAEKQTGVKINYRERVEKIDRTEAGFVIKTDKQTYQSRAVLLTLGRRGTPRTLDVPGEELTKVVYKLIDPRDYQGKKVLVVGGGDSALEAATSIADEPGTSVAISYRSESFSRAKQKNRQRVEETAAAGRLQVLLSSQVKQITEKQVEISLGDETLTLENDAVIVCAGGILPTPFLRDCGILVETKYGTP